MTTGCITEAIALLPKVIPGPRLGPSGNIALPATSLRKEADDVDIMSPLSSKISCLQPLGNTEQPGTYPSGKIAHLVSGRRSRTAPIAIQWEPREGAVHLILCKSVFIIESHRIDTCVSRSYYLNDMKTI